MQDESPDVIDARAESLVEAFEDFKYELVAMREAHGMSQADVAERLGMSQPAVSQFERYDANPTLQTLRRYALAVGARVRIEVIDDLSPVTTSVADAVAFEFEPVPDVARADWGSVRTEASCV